ncbi:GAS2-like protein 1 [Sorex araneus]|uniref:GAS2-like protein 1 n=1 Tax=Sorex araneus TaxID=42254 RepID=UPI002433C3A2|nr:GAS2-like protein 1 [Sorex araneus]
MADPVAGIAGSAAKSVRPFRSSEAYVEAMKEDLAEWLNALYSLGLPSGGEGFLTGLATGTTLCQHANAVTEAARALAAARPARGVAFQAHGVVPGSFMARDNVATFIGWCRGELGVPEVLMFETEDLVLRKNEKSVVLCLLEVARRGARLGLLAPRLVQFEQEIERELRATPPAPQAPTAAAGEDLAETAVAPGAPARGPRMTPSDLRNLDELVREILGRCTCPDQFPMIKVSEGKYRVGDSSLLIFVRVLRSHVMVRVGGGWDTLEHYLDKHDPCRCSSSAHRPSRASTFSPQRVSPAHSPRAASPVPGSERRGSRPEVAPASARSSKEGPETPLRPRDQLPPPHPRSRRYSGDSDSSASSAQSGSLGTRSDDLVMGPPRERPGRRLTTSTPASPRRPPAPRSQSRDRLEQGRPRGVPGGRGARPPAPSPARRARSQSRDEQAVLLVRRDRDGQHSYVLGSRGGSGRSSPQTPRARSPAAPRPPRSGPSPELGPTPASVFRTPLQLDPQEEQQLFQRLEEEFLANARALEAEAGRTPTGPAPEPARAPEHPAPDSAYCSSSSSSSSLSVLVGKCGQPGDSGRMANGLPGARGPALSSSSDEGSPSPGVAGRPDAPGSLPACPETPRTWARGRMDTQPDRKPSRIPTPRGPRRPSGPLEPGAWHALHSVTPRAEPDSWM